jgi:hypothetical protein
MISCRGRHNRVKALSFIVLLHEGRGLTSPQINGVVGCSRNSQASLRTLLVRWCRWKLVSMHMTPDGTRFYSIAPKGEAWLRRHWTEVTYALANVWLSDFWKSGYYSFLFDKIPPAEDTAPAVVDKRGLRGHRRGVAGAVVKT